MVKMLTVLVSAISNSQVILLKNARATHIFSAKILAYMPLFNDQTFNATLTNNIVSFEQLGPDLVYCVSQTVRLCTFGHVYPVKKGISL